MQSSRSRSASSTPSPIPASSTATAFVTSRVCCIGLSVGTHSARKRHASVTDTAHVGRYRERRGFQTPWGHVGALPEGEAMEVLSVGGRARTRDVPRTHRRPPRPAEVREQRLHAVGAAEAVVGAFELEHVLRHASRDSAVPRRIGGAADEEGRRRPPLERRETLLGRPGAASATRPAATARRRARPRASTATSRRSGACRPGRRPRAQPRPGLEPMPWRRPIGRGTRPRPGSAPQPRSRSA